MAQYFKEASEEERDHAQMLITFQVTYQSLQLRSGDVWCLSDRM